jgi:pimeloyl-ACP methyl ester carboxylesterase
MKKLLTIIFISLILFILLSLYIPNIYAAEITERNVEYKDFSIYTQCYNYKEFEKTAIIYVHGLGDSSSSVEFLKNTKNPYMTIAYDNLGHGKSSSVKSCDINWNNQIGIINAIIKDYKLEKVYLVGHSVGADVSMMYTKKYPQKVKKVILLDRAYYNYSDLEQFNFTRDLSKLFGRFSEIQSEVYNKYIDISYDNDITKTWDIKKDTLLIAANPDDSKQNGAFMIETLNDIKENPDNYNITPEELSKLPDLTLQNFSDISDFLREQHTVFLNSNTRFSIINTLFSHNMQQDEASSETVREYILNFINNSNK